MSFFTRYLSRPFILLPGALGFPKIDSVMLIKHHNFCFVLLYSKARRVVGSVVPYENGRNIKDLNDARMFCRNVALPPQTSSQQCFFRTSTLIQEKSIAEAEKDSQTKQLPPQYNVVAKTSYGMAMDVNTNPYYQPQTRLEKLKERIAIDAELLQTQSQFGPVGAASVAAHRNVALFITD
ncbi:hypothetical protein OIU76_026451 [Salix suchowensis]|nr:hypothetical protein OIU78_024935 [Salix suchowensis]KAJ6377481.1 hypothetical protein OIU76_026451 [Salix suchowensis]